ncbi:MAG: hypothetical protein KatS3mg113_0038 [Planctomycetaceae bacterium]|nr:MAG: hypothetical protein KatS3mg113_0038 [Planctomycetaceae bacterium]
MHTTSPRFRGNLFPGLWGAVVLGIGLGWVLSESSVHTLLMTVRASATTAMALSVISVMLPAQRLWQAVCYPGPVLLGLLINLGLLPLLAWSAQPALAPELATGMILACCAPCTLSTASLLARQAGGNEAITMLITVISHLLCVVVTPMWVALLTPYALSLPVGQLMVDLLWTVLVPVFGGQLVRRAAKIAVWVDNHRRLLGRVSQTLVYVTVSMAALRVGWSLQTRGDWPGAWACGILSMLCLAVHLAGVGLGWCLARGMGWPRSAAIAVALGGGQKTLPVALMLAAHPALSTNPFVVLPILMYHVLQLMADGWLVSQWQHFSPRDDVDSTQRQSFVRNSAQHAATLPNV